MCVFINHNTRYLTKRIEFEWSLETKLEELISGKNIPSGQNNTLALTFDPSFGLFSSQRCQNK